MDASAALARRLCCLMLLLSLFCSKPVEAWDDAVFKGFVLDESFLCEENIASCDSDLVTDEDDCTCRIDFDIGVSGPILGDIC